MIGKGAIGLAAILTLAFAGTASAKTVTFIGTFEGQSEPAIGAKVTFDGNGVPQALPTFSYSNLEAPCPADPTGNSVLPLSGSYADSKLKRQGKKYAFKATDDRGGANGKLTGTVSKNGKKLKGEVDDSATFGAAGECSISNAKFTAKPK